MTSPAFARKNTTVGIWNTTPMPSTIFMYRSKTSSSWGKNVRSWVSKLAKNTIMYGNAMKWVNAAPATKPRVVNTANGIANRRALAGTSGASRRHN